MTDVNRNEPAGSISAGVQISFENLHALPDRGASAFRFWDSLNPLERDMLVADCRSIDSSLLAAHGLDRQDEMFWRSLAETSEPFEHVFKWFPLEARTAENTSISCDRSTSTSCDHSATARQLGLEALRQGQVAAVLLAGGQATRLGTVLPKGIYPVGLNGESLYEIFVRKLYRLYETTGRYVPMYIMTSDATDSETRAFFAEKKNFGYPDSEIVFFRQENMPAVDIITGELLLAQPHRLALSPNGHGGVLTAMKKFGLLADMETRGIDYVCTFQVDNPLIPLADPEFLGYLIIDSVQTGDDSIPSDLATMVVRKNGPLEKVGNMVRHGNRVQVVEYSDLPESCARRTDATGELALWMGNVAIHVFRRSFLDRVLAEDTFSLPWHDARKTVKYVANDGCCISPEQPNAIKKERFLFDVFPLARKITIVEGRREDCFAALKNAPGSNRENIDTVQDALTAFNSRYGLHLSITPENNQPQDNETTG